MAAFSWHCPEAMCQILLPAPFLSLNYFKLFWNTLKSGDFFFFPVSIGSFTSKATIKILYFAGCLKREIHRLKIKQQTHNKPKQKLHKTNHIKPTRPPRNNKACVCSLPIPYTLKFLNYYYLFLFIFSMLEQKRFLLACLHLKGTIHYSVCKASIITAVTENSSLLCMTSFYWEQGFGHP